MKITKTILCCLVASSLYSSDGKPLVIGHRGACGHAPENTLISFEKAIEFGVDAIELDVHCCKSGELIVIHDKTIDRTTNGKGSVQDLTLEELQKYRCDQNQIIPTLPQVIDMVNQRCVINIELKGQSTAAPVASLIEEYVQNKGFVYANFIVTSFDHHELYEFHKLVPQVKTGAILEGLTINYAGFAEDAKADFAVVHQETINEKFIQDAHRRKITNTPEDILSMYNLGVDGIISNYPERVKN